MRDLQRRLGAVGYLPAPGSEAGRYCALTEAAVSAFQQERGLRRTGSCDEVTWNVLVEASWHLGDRSLVLRSPNMRGDDIADLQDRLGRLGFDCGRVDGILGPRTAHALAELQRDCGLTPDGVCGTDTVRTLVRLCRQSGAGRGVGAVREIERLRQANRSLVGSKIVVGQFGGFSILTRQLTAGLRRKGAHVVPADEPDPVAQAATANRFDADLYLGVEAHAEPLAAISYYGVPSYESAGGRRLASLIEHQFVDVILDVPLTVQGMRLPVLRETRMPAVLCSLGPVRAIVDDATRITSALLTAVMQWAASPFET